MRQAGKTKLIDPQLVLGQLPLFQQVDREQVALIARHAEQIRLVKGERLFEKGATASGFYVIVSGQIKLALPVNNNNDRVVDILGQGQSFGEALMFLNRPYPVFAQALHNTTLIKVDQTHLFQLIATDPFFARRMLAGMSIRLHHLILDIDTHSKLTSTQRLVSFILQHLPANVQVEKADTPITFKLPEKKQLIASRLCFAPETLSRSLHELSEKGLIETHGSLIVIKNFEGLRSYC